MSPLAQNITLLGSLYAPLLFWHFLADWCSQTEKMAEAKTKQWWPLIIHCAFYTIWFAPIFSLYELTGTEQNIAAAVLFFSHLIGDKGWPVFLWAKYVRDMRVGRYPDDDGAWVGGKSLKRPADLAGVGEVIGMPVLFRPLLLVVADQIWHLAFLWVVPLLIVLRAST